MATEDSTLPRLSLWKDGNHSADYKFQDNRMREMFTAGGTGFNIHKYLGPGSTDDTGDATRPIYTNPTEQSIQDLLFLEDRDRKYDQNIYTLRGHYGIVDTDFNLSQFGLFLTNDTLFLTFHINDMIERMGRKLMAGDVLEFHHLRDFNPLDPNDEIPIALRKYYVVQEATRAAEGFAATWWSHLWRVKVQPMVDSQEYSEILNSQITDPDGNEIGTIGSYLSTYNKSISINDAIIDQAENDVPLSGYDTTPLYVMPTNEDGSPALNASASADSTINKTDSTVLRADHTYVSPKRDYQGYLVGDGIPPNGLPVKSLTYFPETAQSGEYVLRLDFYPNRLFRFDGNKWTVVEQSQRAMLSTNQNNTQWGGFVNNDRQTKTQRGGIIDEKVALSKVLKITPDN
jgi:hypothetical protein